MQSVWIYKTMKFRASWFSENSDRGIAISVSILSSRFSDALFVCFWWLVTLERLLAICIRTFLILQVLNLKPPTWTSRIRIFWLWSEFSDFYPKKNCRSEFSDCDQNFLIVIRIFWLWSAVSDCDQKFLIVIRIFCLWSELFWLWSEFSDCDQNFLIVIQKMQIRIFWLWSEFSDCDQIEKKTLLEWIFWSQSEFSDCDQNFLIVIKLRKKQTRNKQNRKTENNKQRLKTILCFDRPPRHINPGIHSGILLSVISSGVASGVLSGIKYGVLSGKSFAPFTWQKFWRSLWHTFWSDWWKVRLLKICRVWVCHVATTVFFSCLLVFTHRMEEQYDI